MRAFDYFLACNSLLTHDTPSNEKLNAQHLHLSYAALFLGFVLYTFRD